MFSHLTQVVLTFSGRFAAVVVLSLASVACMTNPQPHPGQDLWEADSGADTGMPTAPEQDKDDQLNVDAFTNGAFGEACDGHEGDGVDDASPEDTGPDDATGDADGEAPCDEDEPTMDGAVPMAPHFTHADAG